MAYTLAPMPKIDNLNAVLADSVFAEIDTENLTKLARILECGTTRAGSFVYQLGDASRALYIIISGKVEICDPVSHTVLTTLRRGESFGMLSLFFHSDVSPDVRAVEDSTFIILDAGTLSMIEVSDPALAIVVLRAVRKALGGLVSQVTPVLMRLAL